MLCHPDGATLLVQKRKHQIRTVQAQEEAPTRLVKPRIAKEDYEARSSFAESLGDPRTRVVRFESPAVKARLEEALLEGTFRTVASDFLSCIAYRIQWEQVG